MIRRVYIQSPARHVYIDIGGQRRVVSVTRNHLRVVHVGIQGPPGSASSGGVITGIAGEALGGHRMVTTDSTGKIIHASHATLAHAGRVIGMTTGAAANGATATIQIHGSITEGSWAWTPGSILFLAASGLVTATPPASGFVQVIGYAQSATTIYIQLHQPFIR